MHYAHAFPAHVNPSTAPHTGSARPPTACATGQRQARVGAAVAGARANAPVPSNAPCRSRTFAGTWGTVGMLFNLYGRMACYVALLVVLYMGGNGCNGLRALTYYACIILFTYFIVRVGARTTMLWLLILRIMEAWATMLGNRHLRSGWLLGVALALTATCNSSLEDRWEYSFQTV